MEEKWQNQNIEKTEELNVLECVVSVVQRQETTVNGLKKPKEKV